MKKGFFVIELLIIIAVIAIIAAILIPLLLASKNSSVQVRTEGILKSLAHVEATWCSSDTDRNCVKDYWVIDVSGLYRVKDMNGNSVSCIDITLAKADYNPAPAAAGTPTIGALVAPACTPIPLSGYFFAAFTNDATGNSLTKDIDGNGQAYENTSSFAFQAFPEKYGDNRLAYIMSEAACVLKIDAITPEGSSGRNTGKSFNNAVTGAPTAAAPTVTMSDWPNVNPTLEWVGYAVVE